MKNSVWFLGAGLLAVGCLMSRLDVEDGPSSGDGGDGGVPSSETEAMGGKSNPMGGKGNPSGSSNGEAGTSGGIAGQAQGGETTVAGSTSVGGKGEGGFGGNTTEGGAPSNGGKGGVGGNGGMTNAGSGGSAGSGGASGGNAGSGGSGGASGGSGGASGGSGGASGGSAGSGGASGGNILDVWPSSGCGKTYAGNTGTTVNNLDTSGQKDANCAAHLIDGTPRCGLWGQAASTWKTTPLTRDYYVNLPGSYDKNKPYPLVLEGPGCGGNGKQVYAYTSLADKAIRMGWTPAPTSLVGHGTNPGQGCFDEKEGDDSLDFVFWETLYDKVEAELCFDRNRVFISGDSSGSWMANEMACKYSGDKHYPVRGILANTGGLPNQAQYSPTCTNAPMSGMWVHEVGDQENPFTGAKFAINRAMTVNKCTGSSSYDDAVAKGNLQNYPIAGGNPDTTCKKILGCPADYPLVVCALPGNQHASHTNVVEPGFPVFVTGLMAP